MNLEDTKKINGRYYLSAIHAIENFIPVSENKWELKTMTSRWKITLKMNKD